MQEAEAEEDVEPVVDAEGVTDTAYDQEQVTERVDFPSDDEDTIVVSIRRTRGTPITKISDEAEIPLSAWEEEPAVNDNEDSATLTNLQEQVAEVVEISDYDERTVVPKTEEDRKLPVITIKDEDHIPLAEFKHEIVVDDGTETGQETHSLSKSTLGRSWRYPMTMSQK